jgi:hypothetical protein
MLLCSCATGSEAPTLELDEPELQREALPSQNKNDISQCRIDYRLISGCIIATLICFDEIKDIEIKCDRGRKLFPWEYIPDPAPDF